MFCRVKKPYSDILDNNRVRVFVPLPKLDKTRYAPVLPINAALKVYHFFSSWVVAYPQFVGATRGDSGLI